MGDFGGLPKKKFTISGHATNREAAIMGGPTRPYTRHSCKNMRKKVIRILPILRYFLRFLRDFLRFLRKSLRFLRKSLRFLRYVRRRLRRLPVNKPNDVRQVISLKKSKLNAEYDHSVTSGTASAGEGSPVSPVNSPVSGEKPEKIPKKPEKFPKKTRGMFSPPLKNSFEASRKLFQALFVNPITKRTQPHRLESSLVLHR